MEWNKFKFNLISTVLRVKTAQPWGLKTLKNDPKTECLAKKQDPGPKTHADPQSHTAALSNIVSPPITGPTAHGIALQFANYSSPKLLMDAVRDAIGLTLLKRQYNTDLSHENVIRVIPQR